MPKEIITPAGSSPPLAPYSPGVKANNVVYVSGTFATDSDGKVVGDGDVRVQTRCVIETIKRVIEAAGGSLADVTYNVIFIKDLSDYQAMNEVYGEYFSDRPPARYCIRADMVKPEFLVEISSIAHI
ncbi:pyrimidine utilization protein C [Lacisediminimonas sp.]|uniref:pyrimidine utilization protein C n=1 Tax=Lacisediminimonas sp. TaxID=3060582 RepID=UPI00271E224F|nr:pyrimidine utilization protein C [Lacisediminimonas sp.]MDO8300041.1 pyrimidine utilization protein C [Lacisediminimonas sp.]MDO9217685.1 pyrimidine utilization protein C [Lacisediminimonas sp.]